MIVSEVRSRHDGSEPNLRDLEIGYETEAVSAQYVFGVLKLFFVFP